MPARGFEELVCWQKARVLAGMIYQLTRGGEWQADVALARQMQRAAVSIMANIAEGHDRGSQREFARFLSMAKGSCAELRSHLHIASDVGRLDGLAAEDLIGRATEVSRIIGGLRATVLKHIKP